MNGGIMIPAGSRQGAATPTRERVAVELGDIEDATAAMMQKMLAGSVEAKIPIRDRGENRGCYEIRVGPQDLEKVVPCIVYWNQKQCQTQYLPVGRACW